MLFTKYRWHPAIGCSNSPESNTEYLTELIPLLVIQSTYNKGFINQRTPYCALQSSCAIITVFFQHRVGTTSRVDAMSHKKKTQCCQSPQLKGMTEIVWQIRHKQFSGQSLPIHLPNLLKWPGTTSQEVLINSPSEPAVFHRWDGLGCGRSWIAVTLHTSALLRAAGSFSYRLLLQGQTNASENAQNSSRPS